jgi:hypothetical protein
MKDATLRQSVALPNAANTVNTNVIELPQQATRPFNGNFRVILKNEAATAANTKNLNYRLYATNESNGANAVAASEIFTVVSATTVHPVSTREVYLRPELDKKYIFGSATGEANGGDASDGDLTIEIIG